MQNPRPGIAAALSALLLAGCGTPTLPDHLPLSLSVTSGVTSEGVTARFANLSTSTVGIGVLECWTGAERLVAGEWVPEQFRGEDHTCPLPLILLKPFQAYDFRTQVPAAPGTYRLVASARLEGDHASVPGGGDTHYVVHSAPFEVPAD